jgi:nucleoside-diphosphate-sugar epimerase
MNDTRPEPGLGTVVVFGASGFIGRNLIGRLKGRARRLIAVTHRTAAPPGVEAVPLQSLADLRVDPDAVAVHLAAYRYDAASFRAEQSEVLLENVAILGRVLDFCVRAGIGELRLASSIGVYGRKARLLDDALPLDLADDPFDSELMYGWSKRIAETWIRLYRRKYGLNTIAFRLSNPYGPHDSVDAQRAHVVPALIIRALTGDGPLALRGNADAARDFIFAEDVCSVFERSLNLRGVNAIYNLASGVDTTIRDLARAILLVLGTQRDLVEAGEATSDVIGRSCRVARVKSAFAIESFTGLESGLKKTVEWYRHAVLAGR